MTIELYTLVRCDIVVETIDELRDITSLQTTFPYSKLKIKKKKKSYKNYDKIKHFLY